MKIALTVVALLALGLPLSAQQKTVTFLHVSYDVSRELFQDINKAFVPEYEKKTGVVVKIEQSHAGASKQAKAVASGLPADLLSFNQLLDIAYIHSETKKLKSPVLSDDWQKKFPNDSSPFSSTVAFLVRKGNPKAIKDWPDLVKPGVQLILANPKSSATGRYGFINAYAYALDANGGNETKARDYWKAFINAVPILGNGGRDATTIFTDRKLGDVLVSLEAEAYQVLNSPAGKDFEIVVPHYLVNAQIYIASTIRTDKTTDAAAAAQAYWDYLYSPAGQEIVAQNYYRSILPNVAKRYEKTLPPRTLVQIETVFGSWDAVQKKLFGNGALFDQIYKELQK